MRRVKILMVDLLLLLRVLLVDRVLSLQSSGYFLKKEISYLGT